MTVSAAMIAEKNLVSSGNVTMGLFEVTIPGAAELVRITDNNQNVTWRGYTWQAIPFEWDEIIESSKGEIPRLDIRFGNETRILEAYVQAYDLYTKINGYSPITVSIYLVNSINLASPDPEVEYIFELKDMRSGPHWLTFTLGTSSPYNQRFPLDRIMKNHGRVRKFKDAACGYVGVETTCDRTLAQCRLYGNSGRYCGFPGAGNTALRM